MINIKMLKPKCECGYISVETQDRICPIDKKVMRLQEVEMMTSMIGKR
jgi:uncharacterized protein YunC (DUF1805 family)